MYIHYQTVKIWKQKTAINRKFPCCFSHSKSVESPILFTNMGYSSTQNKDRTQCSVWGRREATTTRKCLAQMWSLVDHTTFLVVSAKKFLKKCINRLYGFTFKMTLTNTCTGNKNLICFECRMLQYIHQVYSTS